MHLHSFCRDAARAAARDIRPGRRTRRATAIASTLLILAGSALPIVAQTPVAQYTGAAGPVGVALDTVGGAAYLYVADEAHGNVLKLNAATGATVATFGTGAQGSAPGQFGRPYGIAVDPVSHDLYVTERLNGRVQRINSSTGASVFAWGTNDAAFNATGQNTNPPNPTAPQGHFQEPIGVAADSAGNVYVVDHGNNRVQKFLVHQVSGAWTADNVAMWGTTGSGNGQFDHPYGAALDASGNLWVADGLNGRVQEFTSAGAYVASVGTKGTGPGQLIIATSATFDGSGALFVTSTNSDPQASGAADINNQWVSKFSAGGAFVSRFGGTYGSNPGEFKLPFGVAVDAANRAYVSDYYNSRVQVFDLATPPGGGGGTGGAPDTTPPTISSFTLGTATATTVNYQLSFNEPVTGVDQADFTATTTGGATATVGAVSGTGATYTIPVTYAGTGTVQLSLKASGTGITDLSGNALATGATGPTYTIGTPSGGGGGGGSGGSGAVAVVSATVPANGTYRAGDALVFKVKFNAPVFVKTTGGDASKNKDAKHGDDDDDDAADDGGPFITWSGADDSGTAKYQSGSGTAELTFKYQVHGNDSAPQGITLGTTLGLPRGVTLADAAGHSLTSLTITWPQNPLPGVILVRANESNHGADQKGGSASAGAGNSGEDARLVNLSSRMKIKGGDASHVVAVGFVVSGSSPQSLLIRAVGPTLRAYGVADALTDPTLTIRSSSGQVVASNDGWKNDTTISSAAQRVGAFALTAGSRDSAVVVTLAPGAYTALVGGASANGVALVEVYDAGSGVAAGPQLANISTRGFVESGADLIAGFVVRGTTPKRVLVRAAGPALAAFGVSGSLPDPVLEVRDSAGTTVARNDNWSTPVAADAAHAPGTSADITAANGAAGAFPFSSGSKDAALIVTLTPGAYSAVVTGAGGASGATLVEVYELP